MLRNVASRVAWVGRTASMVFGLALVLALILGVAGAAFGANGDNFILGSLNNTASDITRLTGNVNGSALQVVNNDPDANDSALSLSVQPGEAPMRVNSSAKVDNLNADRLDGKDSRALGVTMRSAWAFTADCAKNVGSPNECAPVTVKVPAGKHYDVTVLSSFAALAPNSSTTIFYCSAVRTPTTNGCLNANSIISLAASSAESGASSGEATSLAAGSYTFYTDIRPDAALPTSIDRTVHTTVLVRDASVPGPPID